MEKAEILKKIKRQEKLARKDSKTDRKVLVWNGSRS